MANISKTKAFLRAAMAMLFIFTANTFAQGMDTAYVPFSVNVNATATAQLAGGGKFEKSVRSGYTDTLLIVIEGNTPLARHGKTPNPVTMYSSRGKISLELSRQLYRSTDIALYSLNGKQILHGKVAVSEAAKSISHPNVAMGVYLLSVKGVNGGIFTTRLAHSGGGLNIDVAFANGNSGLLMEKAISGNWVITVSAEGYLDTSYAFVPVTGRENILVQDITLRQPLPSSSSEPESLSSSSESEQTTSSSSESEQSSSSSEPESSSSSEISSSSSLVQGPISCPISSVSDGSVTCGGQTYRTVKIGDQVWFAENLDYNSGTGNSSCYGGLESNCATYGRLYDWSTALTVCPEGWHLPSQVEWQTLLSAVGGAMGYGGHMLKMTSGWNSGGNGEDNFGFSALPGGYFDSAFRNVGNTGTWWTSTELGNNAIYRYILYSNNDLYNLSIDKSSLFSVRCVQSSSSSEIIQSSSSVEVISPSCSGNDNTSTHYCSEGTMKEYGVLIDIRDDQTYKTVVIGSQNWMAENLNYRIPDGTSRCYPISDQTNPNDNYNNNCDTYGRLYNWEMARDICPDGWHLPSQEEWEVLTSYIGDFYTAGKKLKATSGWNDYNGASDNGMDEYGFSALPGGYGGSYHSDGILIFNGIGIVGFWWSASENKILGDQALCRIIDYANYGDYSGEGAFLWLFYTVDKSSLLSVRCLQDYAVEVLAP